jgi:hypothetical protein
MQDDIRQSEKGGNTAYLNLGIWYEEATGHIHMTLPNSGWFHTTVNNEVGSKRYHPNLFWKLARALKVAGAPHPDLVDVDAEMLAGGKTAGSSGAV